MYSRIGVQTGEFSLDAVIDELKQQTKAVGGICSFTGCVRDINDGEDVSSLFLEHYPEMTEKQLAKILDTAEARFDLLGAIVIHRIGLLHPGENIVLVAAASAHRAAAFDACHFVMDYLKTKRLFGSRNSGAMVVKRGSRCEKVTNKQQPIGRRRKTDLTSGG